MEEQVEAIAQAQEEEQLAVQQQITIPSGHVPEAVIGRALTSRGSDWRSVERIVAFFQKTPTGSAAASFMEREFGEGGKGVKIAGQDYALWFDKEGFRIAPGRSAFGPGSTIVTWANAAAMTEKLLREGMFAAQEKIDNAQDNEYLELAEKLWYLRQDFSEGAREKNLLPTISRHFFNKGFPDDIQQIAEQLRNPDSRKQILQELAVFMVAYNEDPDLLRFKRIHTPEKLYADVAALYTTPVQFRAAEGFVPAKASFITEDEIDHLLIRGGNVSESKLRIYSYFIQDHDAKECADFLKQEYGSGGHSSIGFAERHDSKGIRFTRQDKESGYKGYDTVKLNWNQVQKRIRGLIDSGRYLNEQEKAYLPSYDKLALAREIYAFNYYKPNDPDGTHSHEWDPETAKRDILPLLDSPEQVEKLFDRMLDDFAPLSPDTPHYITLRTALRDVGMYQRGESPFFSPLPEKVLQAERRGRWAAKEAKRAEQVQHTPPPLKEPEGRLAAAARALSKKMQPQAVEEDDGQIAFDLFSPQPQESPIVEALTPTKEQAGTPVSTAVLPPDYKAIKEANPDRIVLYQVGDAFEIFGEDAKLAASILKLEPTRLVPDMNQITACGIPANKLDEYVEKLRDQHDVTLVSFDEQTGERRSRTVLSIDHEAERAIDRHEAEFGADGWRVFRDTGEKDMSGKEVDPAAALTAESSLDANSTIKEIYEHYAPMVKNLVLVDDAYRNACVNSDRDLAHLEGSEAVKRAVLTINDPVLMKQYYDNAAFRNRLHQEIISETYPTLSQLQQEQAEPLSPRSVGAPVKSQQSNRPGRSKQEVNYRTFAQMSPEQIKPSAPNPFLDYNAIKEAHPDSIVLYQVGDFFEMYGEDARTAAPLLGLNKSTRAIPNVGRVDFCGVPSHALDQTVEKLRVNYDVTLAPFDETARERQTHTMRSFDKIPPGTEDIKTTVTVPNYEATVIDAEAPWLARLLQGHGISAAQFVHENGDVTFSFAAADKDTVEKLIAKLRATINNPDMETSVSTDSPEWLKKALADPAVEHLAAEQDGGNTTVPQASGMVPDLTGAGAPEQEESVPSAAVEPNLTPNVEEYLNLKVQHPDKLIGVQVGDYMLFLSAPMIKCKKTPRKKCRIMAERREKR